MTRAPALFFLGAGAFALVLASAPACSDSASPGSGEGGLYTDAGNLGPPCTAHGAIHDPVGHALEPFCAPSDPGPGAIYVSASGEVLALYGFRFPPLDPTKDTWMVDGWDIRLDAYITVFDAITVWQDPDLAPTDPSRHGPEVARLDGPFVVDLHKGGTLAGQGGGGEQATPIGAILQMANGQPFDPTVTYAFGFSTVAAPSDYRAFNVNLTPDENDDYAYMAANGYSVLYVGTATWNGAQSLGGVGGSCVETTVTPPYDFGASDGGVGSDGGPSDGGSGASAYPQSMRFMLGFSTPTNYVNCQNGTEFTGTPGVDGEDHPRGVQVHPSVSVPAQVTIHVDHPFWDSFAENSPVHWDAIASQYVGAPRPIVAHTEDLIGVDFTAFVDGLGNPVPWRSCTPETLYPLPNSGQMHFDPLNVPVDIGSKDPTKALRDYYDYIRYTQSTQGHLNSQGLCFIDRRYPAPGGR